MMLRNETDGAPLQRSEDLHLHHGWRFPVVHLTKDDANEVFELGLKLSVSHVPTVEAACIKLLEVSHDFPAEVFLQRPSIVQALVTILQSPNCSINCLPLQALRCLRRLTHALKISLQAYSDIHGRSPPRPPTDWMQGIDSAAENKQLDMEYPAVGTFDEWNLPHRRMWSVASSGSSARPVSDALSVNQFADLILRACIPMLKDQTKIGWVLPLIKDVLPLAFNRCTASKSGNEECMLQLKARLSSLCDVLSHFSIEAIVHDGVIIHVADLVLLCLERFIFIYVESDEELSQEEEAIFIDLDIPTQLLNILGDIAQNEFLEWFWPQFRARLLGVLKALQPSAYQDYAVSRQILESIECDLSALGSSGRPNATRRLQLVCHALPGLEFSSTNLQVVCDTVLELLFSDQQSAGSLGDKELVARNILISLLVHLVLDVRKYTYSRLVDIIGSAEHVANVVCLYDVDVVAHVLLWGTTEEDPDTRLLAQSLLSSLAGLDTNGLLTALNPLYAFTRILALDNAAVSSVLRLYIEDHKQTDDEKAINEYLQQNFLAECRFLFYHDAERRSDAARFIQSHLTTMNGSELIQKSSLPFEHSADPFSFLFQEHARVSQEWQALEDALDTFPAGSADGDASDSSYELRDVRNMFQLLVNESIDLDLRISAAQQLGVLLRRPKFMSLLQSKALFEVVEQELRVDRYLEAAVPSLHTRRTEFAKHLLVLLFLHTKVTTDNAGMIRALECCLPYAFHLQPLVRLVAARIVSLLAFSTPFLGYLSDSRLTDTNVRECVLIAFMQELFVIPNAVEFYDTSSFAASSAAGPITANARQMVADNIGYHAQIEQSESVSFDSLVAPYLDALQVADTHLLFHQMLQELLLIVQNSSQAMEKLLDSRWQIVFDRFLVNLPRNLDDEMVLQSVLDFIAATFILTRKSAAYLSYVCRLLTSTLLPLVSGEGAHDGSGTQSPAQHSATSLKLIYFQFLTRFVVFLNEKNMAQESETLMKRETILKHLVNEVAAESKLGFNAPKSTALHNIACMTAEDSAFGLIVFTPSVWRSLVSQCITCLSQPNAPNSFQSSTAVLLALRCLVNLTDPEVTARPELEDVDWFRENTLNWLQRQFHNRESSVRALAFCIASRLLCSEDMLQAILQVHPTFLQWPLRCVLDAHHLSPEQRQAMIADQKAFVVLQNAACARRRFGEGVQSSTLVHAVQGWCDGVVSEDALHTTGYLYPVHSAAARSAALSCFTNLSFLGSIPSNDMGTAPAQCLQELIGRLPWLLSCCNPSDSPAYYVNLVVLLKNMLLRVDQDALPTTDFVIQSILSPRAFPFVVRLLDFSSVFDRVSVCRDDSDTEQLSDSSYGFRGSGHNSLSNKVHLCQWTSERCFVDLKRSAEFAECTTQVLQVLHVLTERNAAISEHFLRTEAFTFVLLDIFNAPIGTGQFPIAAAHVRMFEALFRFLSVLVVSSREEFLRLLHRHRLQFDTASKAAAPLAFGADALRVMGALAGWRDSAQEGQQLRRSMSQFLILLTSQPINLGAEVACSELYRNGVLELTTGLIDAVKSAFDEDADSLSEVDNAPSAQILAQENKQLLTNALASLLAVSRTVQAGVAVLNDSDDMCAWIVERLSRTYGLLCIERAANRKEKTSARHEAASAQRKQLQRGSNRGMYRRTRGDSSSSSSNAYDTNLSLDDASSIASSSSMPDANLDNLVERELLLDIQNLIDILRNLVYLSDSDVRSRILKSGVIGVLGKAWPLFVSMRSSAFGGILVGSLAFLHNLMHDSEEAANALLSPSFAKPVPTEASSAVTDSRKNSRTARKVAVSQRSKSSPAVSSTVLQYVLQLGSMPKLPLRVFKAVFYVVEGMCAFSASARLVYKSGFIPNIVARLLASTKQGHRNGILAYLRNKTGNSVRLLSLVRVLASASMRTEGAEELSSSIFPSNSLSAFIELFKVLRDQDPASHDLISTKEQVMLLLRNLTFARGAKTALLANQEILPLIMAVLSSRYSADHLLVAHASHALWNLVYNNQKGKAHLARFRTPRGAPASEYLGKALVKLRIAVEEAEEPSKEQLDSLKSLHAVCDILAA